MGLPSLSQWRSDAEKECGGDQNRPDRGLLCGTMTSRLVKSLLPAASQRFIQLNQSQQLVELGLDKAQFGGEGVGFVGQHFEITGDAARVSHVGKARCILRGLEQKFFLSPKFP